MRTFILALLAVLGANGAAAQPCNVKADSVRNESAYNHLEPALAAELGGWDGGLRLPYSGKLAHGPRETDIEHIVSFGEALATGGCGWTEDEWDRFAADMDNLTLALPNVNSRKGARDEASWLPDKNRCWFVGRRTVVMERYNLVRRPEAQAVVRRILAERTCQGL